MATDRQIIDVLSNVTTATITTILLKKGLRNVWLRGARPLRPDQPRLVGRAFTLRFVPAREDLANAPEILVLAEIDPRRDRGHARRLHRGRRCNGVTDAGIFGDILCARMAKRGIAALVTDGMVRDIAGVQATGLPVWCQGIAAPPSVAGLTFVNWQEPIGCGGVAVFPDDILVADGDGVVVIPAALVDSVLELAIEQEQLECLDHEGGGGGCATPRTLSGQCGGPRRATRPARRSRGRLKSLLCEGTPRCRL